jgi:hypothetical protein
MRALLTDGGDASLDQLVGSVYAADGVVDLPGAVDGEDYVIEQCGDIVCAL